MKHIITIFNIYMVSMFNLGSIIAQQTYEKRISTQQDEIIVKAVNTSNNMLVFNMRRGNYVAQPTPYTAFYNYHNLLYKADINFNLIDSIKVERFGRYRPALVYLFKLNNNMLLWAGPALDTISRDFQICMVWLDQNLNIIKKSIYGLPNRSIMMHNVQLNPVGNIVWNGKIEADGSLSVDLITHDYFFWEFSVTGDEIKYATTSLPYNTFIGIVPIGNQGKYMVHHANKIIRLHADFSEDTIINFTYPHRFMPYQFLALNQNGYLINGEIVGGEALGFPINADLAFLHIDALGNISKMNRYGSLDTLDRYGQIRFFHPDTLFVAGLRDFRWEVPDSYISIYKTNVAGAVFFTKHFGGYGKYYLGDVTVLADGGCIVTGGWWDAHHIPAYEFQMDAFLFKINKHGIITGSNAQWVINSKEIVVYPNPVGDRLYFSGSQNYRNLVFELYSAEGRLVKKEILNRLDETIDMSLMPRGLYFYRLNNTKGFSEKGKLMKM